MRRLLVLCLLTTLACGKRGDPRPPVPIIPQATSDLVVAQRADKVILSWSYPSLTTAGRSLSEIRRISIYRLVEDLPVAPGGRDPQTLQPGNVDPTQPEPIALFARIPTIPQAQFQKLSSRVDSIEEANLATATAGAKLLYTDTPPMRSQDGRPVRLTYAVVTEGATARSEPSNLAIIVPLPVAVPPASLQATAKPEGIALTWQEPKQSIGNLGTPIVIGYNIFRTAPGEALTELSAPINTAPIKGSLYTDTPPYGEHEYRIAAVASADPLLQSDPSAPARATFRDLVAPPSPGNVTALVETNHIRLLWDPVTAPDLAGYFIYRWEGTVRLKLCCPTPSGQPNFLDISMQRGEPYRYEVTAVDASGNESAPGSSETITLPRTP
ncbi:MAG TPA: fibronectin type III domain-containing protein [Thermoanaerobaculia bacterium]|nr:fibronectin type III domain-containing protein [Thermoanaerobaculia bacterium]